MNDRYYIELMYKIKREIELKIPKHNYDDVSIYHDAIGLLLKKCIIKTDLVDYNKFIEIRYSENYDSIIVSDLDYLSKYAIKTELCNFNMDTFIENIKEYIANV